MRHKNKIVVVVIYTILLLIIAGTNIRYNFIIVPSPQEMISRQINYITISTVFVGFSFTALGLLLGMSSEKLIEKVKNTDIIIDKAKRIIGSIIEFILSVAISLVFVLGLDVSLIKNTSVLYIVDNYLYILSIGYLVGGIIYFVYVVYELYDLVKRVYAFNRKAISPKIATIRAELEATREKMQDKEEND